MISRLSQTSLKLNRFRLYSTQSNLLNSIQNDSSVKNLNSVFAQAKENNIKDANVYKELFAAYAKAQNLDGCANVLIDSKLSGIDLQVSSESAKQFSKIEDLQDYEEFKDEIHKEYQLYKKALTRKN